MAGDDDDFNDAFDRREMQQLSRDLGPIFREYGHGTIDRSVQAAERHRVANLIERDRRYTARENARALADLEVREGIFVNIGDIVVEPTEEWLQRGNVRLFTPRLSDGTVRTIQTVRRVVTPIIVRMEAAGKITSDQAAACLWYRSRFEAAGLEGRFKTSNLSGMGGAGGAGDCQSPMARHEDEVDARIQFRDARAALPPRMVKFFDAVVLHDLSLRRASRLMRCDNSRLLKFFRDTAQRMVHHCEAIKAPYHPDEGGDDD